MLDYDDLKYAHKDNCKSKDSQNVEHKNSYFDENCEVKFDCYCKECGTFLYNFCYGHYEI